MAKNLLRDDLLTIWNAGVDAVRSDQLMRQAVQCDGQTLTIAGQVTDLSAIERIVVVGAGKAGAGMAAEFEAILGPTLVAQYVTGHVNVPADCIRTLQRITLHPGRPAGVNEPTELGVVGTGEILKLVSSVGPQDLCVVLLSGGGSALLPAPVPGISLADKQAVTRFLMRAGATIHELNGVRKRLSLIKGGGLARACPTGRLTTLIISDVVGDPLDILASGPTVNDFTSPQVALDILAKFSASSPDVPQSVFEYLTQAVNSWAPPAPLSETIRNVVIGNNATALAASAEAARRLGYRVDECGSDNQGDAAEVGRDLYRKCRQIVATEPADAMVPRCILSGGEPTVRLPASSSARKGGRNQQLVLAACCEAWNDRPEDWQRISLLSGGTDGEDGPTNAAGAWFDAPLMHTARAKGLDPAPFLDDCNAYPYFETCGGLIITGPTHTNVMDLRVALVR